ncbi:porin [Paraburkholderia tagetis]|uniref:Porin n=1 Tax=Paraburkholderia tagetis TaxID=2913261 RepID=A0A9X1RIK7_9BURK|nr:porin [Paraburkholderia tagetis]MCG5071835.1 porin [Paraburkholderia tagetis]
MKKKIPGIMLLGGIAITAHAQTKIALYGLFDAGISYANHSTLQSAGPSHSVAKFDDGVSQGNRWGMQGSEYLGDGLKAIFIIESGISLGNGKPGQGSREFGRQAFIGLSKKSIGTLTFGRQNSLTKDILLNYTTARQTPAGNYAYHIADVDQISSSRIDNAIKFLSRNAYGFTFGAMYGFSNQPGEFSGSPASNTRAGSGRTYNFGTYYAAGPFSAGMTWLDIRFPATSGYPSPTAFANVQPARLSGATIKDLRTFGIGTNYTIGATTIWALYTNTRFVPVSGQATRFDAYEAGAKYAFTQAMTTGLGYIYMNTRGNNTAGHWNQLDGSIDYASSKTTDVYLLMAYQIASGHVRGQPLQALIGSSQTAFFGTSGSNANNQLALRLGIRHKF